MMTLPRLRIANFGRGAIPVALLCAIASWPAAAITIDTSPVAKPGTSTTQLSKADKQQLKAERQVEKQARKAYQRCMKLARKNGVAANCKPSSSEGPPVATVAATPPPPAPPPVPVVAPPVTQSAPPAQQPPVPAPPAQANVVTPPAAPTPPPVALLPPAQANVIPPPVVPPPPAVSIALLGAAPIPPSIFLPKSDGSGSSGTMLMTTVAPVSSVPEPGSLALLSVGLLGLGFAARRRKQRVA